MKSTEKKRPSPFEGRTLPYANLTLDRYGERIQKWFDELRVEFATYAAPGGSLGVDFGGRSGEIGNVRADSQAWKLQRQEGWHVVELNGRPYSPTLFPNSKVEAHLLS